MPDTKHEPDLHGDDRIPKELIELGTYDWPRSAVRQTLGHLIEKLKAGFNSDVSENAIEEDMLSSATEDALKGRVTDTLASVLAAQLDETFLDWANATDDPQIRRAFVHPPMHGDPLGDWAEKHGFPILQPGDKLADHSDATCVVIPKLEAFFSRDHTKLSPLFDVFDTLNRFDGKVIVGCNSWAWQFLKQFDDAILLFGQARTIPAFNENAMAALLGSALSNDRDCGDLMSVASGEPILARDDDDELVDPYLEKLCGLSLGMPWVAIEMLFRGIAETKEEERDEDDHRIWVDLPKACTLPPSGSDALLFALHTLMIHGDRMRDDLNDLIPLRAPNGLWAELERTGFVEIHDDRVFCAVRNYPDIRSELNAAGFNLDEL